MHRRSFIHNTLLGSSSFILPWKINSDFVNNQIQIGIIADPHQDLMHDVEERLSTFMQAADERSPDLIIQLGDFCHPKKENINFLSIWNQFPGPKYHVLGNHDMDTTSKNKTMDFWGMPDNYYSFDAKGFHFIVLDANFINDGGIYKDYDNSNFYIDASKRTWIHPDQIDWLEEDLSKTTLPTLLFSHQSLVTDLWGVKNRTRIQKVLEKANLEAGFQKVISCFNGHNHIDAYRKINGIYYIDINSMSYQWLGENYQCTSRYSPKIYEQFPNIKYMAPYENSLFAFLTIRDGMMEIKGKDSNYIGPSPEELGLTESVYGIPFTSNISSQKYSF